MTPLSLRPPALIAALVLLASLGRPAGAASAAAGTLVPRLVLPADGVVRAGDRVEIRWTRPAGAIEELEIRLSIDGGRHYAVRVSPELEGEQSRYVWRVPNLASADARLRLRYDVGGQEIEGEPGASFRIVGRDDHPVERALVHDASWWEGPVASEGGGSVEFAPDGPRLSATGGPPAGGDAPRAPALAPRPAILVAVPDDRAATSEPTSPVALATARRLPLRE